MMFRKKPEQPQQKQRTTRTNRDRADVFSYHANRSRPEAGNERIDVHNTSGIKNQKKKVSWKHIPSITAGIIIFGAIFYTTIIDVNNPKIVPLSKTTPNILRTNKEYEQGVKDVLSKSIWSRSKFSVNTEELATQIKQQFTELGEVSITMQLLGRRPIIQITPASPALIVGNQTAGPYVVGEDGRVLMLLSDLPDNQGQDLIRVEDVINSDFEMGKLALPKSTVDFLNKTKYYLNQKNIQIKSVRLPAVANELHLELKDAPYVIKFNLQDDPMEQVGRYVTLMEHIQSQSKPAPTEYVDVRVEDRVYYK